METHVRFGTIIAIALMIALLASVLPGIHLSAAAADGSTAAGVESIVQPGSQPSADEAEEDDGPNWTVAILAVLAFVCIHLITARFMTDKGSRK